MRQNNSTRRVQGYCALCWSKCGCISVVENNRLVAVEPDRQHPTGQALCAKGRAAPELVNHEDRLLYPLKRTRPKGDPDPGWERIGWNEALDTISSKLKEISGAVPSLSQVPFGCPFHPRCSTAETRCKTDKPKLKKISQTHSVSCWLY